MADKTSRQSKRLLAHMTEAELQNAVVDLARLLGYLVHHSRPAQNRKGKWSTPIQGDAGFPDLCIAGKGRLLFVELKSEEGKMSVEQEVWRDELALASTWSANKIRWVLWRPQNWVSGDIERILKHG